MMAAFDSIHTVKPSPFIRLIHFLSPILYALFKVTLKSVREEKLAQSVAHLNGLTANSLNKSRKEPEDTDFGESVLGILVKSENVNPNSRLSLAEITTQAVRTFVAPLTFSCKLI
ncbi:hypothetical protein APHAL10511_000474 [Amanita phalloides]|nr:hypothetical protein APHAL10511_000474 [Amanita phalloides]